MSRRRKKGEHANHERWLVSYADFITLLFAFFVVMFSSAQVDKRKVGKLAMAIQDAFQQLGIFQTSNSRLPLSTTEPMPFENTQAVENAVHTTVLGRVSTSVDGVSSSVPGVKSLSELQRELEKALAPELKRHEVALKAQREGLVISLREIGFFDSGSAILRPTSEASVRRIATVLAEQPNGVRIEGHTDNVPIHNERFASNWELSTARATEMVRVFIVQYHFPPGRLSAAGYAEYHPVSTNETSEGRAMNRRVDIVVVAPHPSDFGPAVSAESPPPSGNASPAS
jgi:chemotaxis protein MotB